MGKINVEKLLESFIEEDVCLGIICLLEDPKWNSLSLQKYLKSLNIKVVGIEIYYKNYNIIFYKHLGIIVYNSNTEPGDNLKQIYL